MPSATGQSWEKYQKNFADDEEPEKKITPLTDESVIFAATLLCVSNMPQRYPGAQNLWRRPLRCCVKEAGEANKRKAKQCQ